MGLILREGRKIARTGAAVDRVYTGRAAGEGGRVKAPDDGDGGQGRLMRIPIISGSL